MQLLSTIRAYFPHFLAKGTRHNGASIQPQLVDVAPVGPTVTSYDEEHITTYLRVLNAVQDGADWRDVSRTVLHVDPDHDVERARQTFDSHFARAKWMTQQLVRVDRSD